MPTVEFGRLQDARQIRQNRKYRAFLEDSDNGREKTVRLKDNTPKSAVKEIRGEAAESRQHEREKAGQVELTRTERREIDFSKPGVNVPKARSIKGIAANEGVDDWMAYGDLEQTVDENRSILKRGKKEEQGGRMDAVTDESHQIDRAARAHQQVKQQANPRAREYAFSGDEEAQEHLRDRGLGESLDIGFTQKSGRIEGQGEDFERLQKFHESRSEQAQAMDNRKSAPKTRDPFVWMNNPGEYDYPGVDTVQPKKLHEQRSEKAQDVDERELAPVAETKQQWAMHPDQYDWRGVDTPTQKQGSTERDAWAANPEAAAGVDDDELGEYLFSAQASARDVSLAPDEGLRGVGSGSAKASRRPMTYGGEDEEAFMQAEEQRAAEDEEMPFVDDRDQQGSLAGFGMETDGTAHRESREAVEEATEFGVDDRNDASRGGGSGSDSGSQEEFGMFDDEDESDSWF